MVLTQSSGVSVVVEVVDVDEVESVEEIGGCEFSAGWLGVELGFEPGVVLEGSLGVVLDTLLEAASLEVLLDADGVYLLSVITRSSSVFFRLLSVSG